MESSKNLRSVQIHLQFLEGMAQSKLTETSMKFYATDIINTIDLHLNILRIIAKLHLYYLR